MTQKAVAIKCLETLDIYKPYIRKFKSKESMPCFFENYAGFWADQEEKLWAKLKEVEAQYECLVYAITHKVLDGQHLWSMLCVPKDLYDAKELLSKCSIAGKAFYAFSYTWNASYEEFSEFGDVIVQSFGGGIRRII